jgi:PAS domain S-box-containing protein
MNDPFPPLQESAQKRVEMLHDTLDQLAQDVQDIEKNHVAKQISAFRASLKSIEQELSRLDNEQNELKALYDISQAVGSSLNLSEVLNEVMDRIIELTGAERSYLMLVDPDSGEMEFRAARNMDRETIDSSSFEISRSVVRQVATSGEPILTTNAQMDPRFKSQESVIGYSLRSILCVPLRLRGRTTGVIYADNRVVTDLFSNQDRDLLVAFAGQAAVAIENARLFESIANAKTLMDNVFASITSGVITTDIKGQITLFNQAAEQILGVSSAAVTGIRLDEAVPTLASEIKPLVDRVKSKGETVVGYEHEVALPARERVNLRTSLSPLKNTADRTQGVAIVLDDLTEQRRLEASYELFQRYLSPAVIRRLPKDPYELKLGGQRQTITSLFADIRGFTDFSRRHAPEELIEILNQYLAISADAILTEEGTLDKILGDCVVGIFNAPLRQPYHVLRAIRAALKIQDGASWLHQSLPPERQLSYGIGISVGDAVVGNIGTEQQMNYTAVGSSVNLAARLEEVAGPGEILLAEAAYQRAKESVEVQELPPITLEGFSKPIKAYKLLGLT